MGGYIKAISRQRLGIRFLVARQYMLNNATAGLKQWKNCVLCVFHAESSVREFVKGGSEPEAEEYSSL
jgi:hypothetical protein